MRSNSGFKYIKLTPEVYSEKLIESSTFYLIDVRTPSEFRKSHIHGAMNVNFFTFNFGKRTEAFDRNKPVFIYCHTCHRSPFCARRLKHKGFMLVYDMKKGFTKWLKAGLPVDSGNPAFSIP